MYRATTQKFADEVTTCYKEFSGKGVGEQNKKTIEGKLKSRTDTIKTILEKIRDRLIEGIAPDKQAGGLFETDQKYKLSNPIKELLKYCIDILKKKLEELNKKENSIVGACTVLLRKSLY